MARKLVIDDLLNTIFSLLAPFLAPGLVFAHSTSSTTVIIKWSRLPEKDFHGQPIGYNITYSSLDLQSEVNVIITNYTANTTTLTNLTVYTIYVINVSAVSSGGIGPANTVTARTDSDGTDDISIKKNLEGLITLRHILCFQLCLNFNSYNVSFSTSPGPCLGNHTILQFYKFVGSVDSSTRGRFSGPTNWIQYHLLPR